MSCSAIPASASRALSYDNSTRNVPTTLSRWQFVLTAIILGSAVFVTEHDLSISLDDAYTQTADEMEVTAAGGNFVRRLAFPAIGCLGIWLLIAAKAQPLRINALLALPIMAYLTIAAASWLWSIEPGICLRRLIVVACCASAALGIARRFTMREICLLVLATVGPLILIGIAAEIRLGAFRPWAGDYRLSGSVHPNTEGMYLTTLALAALGLARSPDTRRRGWMWAIFAASLLLILLTKSRTGTASTFAAIGCVFLIQTSLQFKLSAGVAWMGASLAGLWLLFVAGYDPLVDFHNALLLGRAEESDTLSGRAFIWPAVWYFIARRPWLGYGYESFWNPRNIDTISDEVGWGLREAHNGYLDILLSTGAIGLTCCLSGVAAGIAAAARRSVKLRDTCYALPLGMLVFGLLSSTMESGMVNVMFPPFLVACCLMRMGFFEEVALPIPQMTNDQ